MVELKENLNIQEMHDYVKLVLKERGFEDETAMEKCLLLGEEIGELFKAVRKHHSSIKCDDNSKFGSVEHELADVLMYTFDIANKLGVDLEKAFKSKEEINKQRKWK